jgi:hypothetical protein
LKILFFNYLKCGVGAENVAFSGKFPVKSQVNIGEWNGACRKNITVLAEV